MTAERARVGYLLPPPENRQEVIGSMNDSYNSRMYTPQAGVGLPTNLDVQSLVFS